ncbi:DUF305 domain-containing protein [Streptomyces paludis]|uniref:DUF305 domain-containing protein n=1 Tax=Streptomyces paludis TaxID=2282738 RepID=A0A345HI29_9ACTN|nr:DUF305 domain-containing protein [Streptomyces paludis]AXG76353.1 DUF305 domain-containing protein [Streptomyces paludis]
MTSYRFPVRRAALAAATAAAALVLTACGGGDGASADRGAAAASASPDTVIHNAADVSFAQGMIPHHRQAVKMAAVAVSRASSAEVKSLASEIKRAQSPEIRTLSGWLTAWGKPAPAKDAAGHDAAGHANGSMPEAMPEAVGGDEMATLEGSSGKEFDTAFLKLMVEHHEGALAMARTERADGANQAAKELADAIITSQAAEITRMKALLNK